MPEKTPSQAEVFGLMSAPAAFVPADGAPFLCHVILCPSGTVLRVSQRQIFDPAGGRFVGVPQLPESNDWYVVAAALDEAAEIWDCVVSAQPRP